MNYFKTLKLKAKFDIDLGELEKNYYQKIHTEHPDKCTNGNRKEAEESIIVAAHINSAYLTLKNPISRAEHILQIEKGSFTSQKHILETKFLFTQMHYQETIQELKVNFDLNRFDDISREVKDLYQKNMESMQQELKNQNWQEAEQYLLKIKMLNGLNEKLSAAEDEFYEIS